MCPRKRMVVNVFIHFVSVEVSSLPGGGSSKLIHLIAVARTTNKLPIGAAVHTLSEHAIGPCSTLLILLVLSSYASTTLETVFPSRTKAAGESKSMHIRSVYCSPTQRREHIKQGRADGRVCVQIDSFVESVHCSWQ